MVLKWCGMSLLTLKPFITNPKISWCAYAWKMLLHIISMFVFTSLTWCQCSLQTTVTLECEQNGEATLTLVSAKMHVLFWAIKTKNKMITAKVQDSVLKLFCVQWDEPLPITLLCHASHSAILWVIQKINTNGQMIVAFGQCFSWSLFFSLSWQIHVFFDNAVWSCLPWWSMKRLEVQPICGKVINGTSGAFSCKTPKWCENVQGCKEILLLTQMMQHKSCDCVTLVFHLWHHWCGCQWLWQHVFDFHGLKIVFFSFNCNQIHTVLSLLFSPFQCRLPHGDETEILLSTTSSSPQNSSRA